MSERVGSRGRSRTNRPSPPPAPRSLSPLCADGVAEIQAHPWLRGIDWGRLHEATAPYFTPALAAISDAMERLRALPLSSPEVPGLLKTLTQNFDDFSALPPDDPRHATPGGGAGDGGGGGLAGALAATTRGSRKARSKFVGYTFKRAPDARGGGTYLPGVPGASFGGSSSGSSSVSLPAPPLSTPAATEAAATTMAAASAGQAVPLPLPLPPPQQQPPTTTPR